ncbi:cytochrome b/b6 domain-containing protein [Alteromonas sp. H39]|uniref:cytochrome b/b6 domain-containing protein n=1 Tax=Alteromonas sp. H39 TaxID=3389876 RepID=UPI0039DFA3AD
MATTIRVWDPFIRICHWTLVTVFTLNYFVLEPGDLPHEILGYIAFGLILVRIVWGVIATNRAGFRHASFRKAAFSRHITELKNRNVSKTHGHNPVGWLMVFLVIGLFTGLGVTGFMMEEIDAFWGNQTLQGIHEWLAHTLYAAAIVHIVAVILTQWWGKVALIPAMITGKRHIDNN